MSAQRQYRTDAHTDEEIRAAVEELLGKMTLKEKLGQMTQHPGMDVSAIGADIKSAPLLQLVKEGAVGSQIAVIPLDKIPKILRETQRIAVEESRLGIPMLFCQDVIHGYQTVFPIPLGWSCSFNPELIKKAQQIAAKEASSIGISLGFSPMVDIAHDPRWGRISEGAGEDPYLGSLIAKAHVEGFQGDSLAKPDTIAACVKHYLGYGAAEAGRDYNTCEFSETALRNTYLPPFKAAVEAGVDSLMTAFNVINGVPAVGNKKLCKDLLRDELGFKGVIISDYAAVDELIVHGNAEDGADAARLSVNATLDIEMSTTHIIENAEQLIKENKITLDEINEATRRILTLKYKLGLMEDPYRYFKDDQKDKIIYCKEHLEVARDLARRSIVLLENKNEVLPLKKDQKVAVIGPFGNSRDLLGPWQFSDFKDKVPTVVEALKERGVNVVGHEDGSDVLKPIDGGIEKAVALAKQADVVLLAVGEASEMSGEAACRLNIVVPEPQFKLAEAVVAAGKPVVVLLNNGRPLILKWFQEHCQAIVETWKLGSMASVAITDVLLGEYNPSGKLTVTFPEHPGQIPLYYNHFNTGRPCLTHNNEKYLSKYLDGFNEPLYTFGYGLSYTKFEIKNLKLSAEKINFNEQLQVTAEVTNAGKVAGEETIQLYVRDIAGSVVRPVLELKGIEKVFLQPGEKKEVKFNLCSKCLRFYNQDNVYAAEPGKFDVFVGNSSESKDLLKGHFQLTK
ncbi:hypothetical protein M9Y10_040972 [Tritrichomonas musculus]|uniref:beta-glucosidase n=1 Tax=Tritrichomonas musculus TaxID=1915356 RepID=A0ABR2K3T2_9EUKA